MATIGDTDLRVDDMDIACGAAFQLSTPAVADMAQTHDDGVQVIIQRGRRYAIALLPQLHQDAAIAATAYRRVQQTLDVLSIEGQGDLAVPGGLDGDLVWWRQKDKVCIRVSVIASREFSMSISAIVRDAAGNVIPPPAPPQPSQWHPAYRYFRLSQTSNDLYEAYRNMYLAFEAVASSLCPKENGERETKWLRRAARSFDQLLAGYVKPGAIDVVEAFVREQHEANRCALFHAKQQQQPLLPGELSNRKQVAQAYERLAQLVIKLCQQHLHARRHISFITKSAVQHMMDSLAPTLVIAVSSERNLPETPIIQWDKSIPITDLTTAYAGMVDDAGFIDAGFTHEFRGRRAVTELASLHVRSVGCHGGTAQPTLLTEGHIDDLFLEGVDMLEVSHIFVFSNRSSPRTRFAL